MKILSGNGNSFELLHVEYLFPQSKHRYMDANMLWFEFEAAEGGGLWRSGQSGLMTWDLNHFVDWVDSLADYEPLSPYVFLGEEDSVGFEVKSKAHGSFQLELSFENGCEPPWMPGHMGDAPEFTLTVELTLAELSNWADALRRIKDKVPVRAGVGESLNIPGAGGWAEIRLWFHFKRVLRMFFGSG